MGYGALVIGNRNFLSLIPLIPLIPITPHPQSPVPITPLLPGRDIHLHLKHHEPHQDR